MMLLKYLQDLLNTLGSSVSFACFSVTMVVVLVDCPCSALETGTTPSESPLPGIQHKESIIFWPYQA
jgi:hypothetical protein